MSDQPLELPEPLQSFSTLAVPLGALLNDADACAARFRQSRTSGKILPNTLEALRIELTYHSNAIEGSTLSLRETQLVIEGKAPAGEKSLREIYEARNHDRALRIIERWAAEKPATPITDQDLLDVHAQVLAEIDNGMAGQFRSERVRIAGSGFIPPGSHKFVALIPKMIELANRARIHPVLQAAELHYNLVAIHPFNDGNGRTARLMMNHHLLRHGYPYAIIEIGERGRYLAALDEANATKPRAFAELVISGIMRTCGKLLME
ncbi:MAG: Fic family protein [Planctomycetota bacterium]|nr:Fic family protein [Planctomycetota bacterium]